MANYLERVASSAGRRAAVARPPVSGPPVLPAGRDFAITPADPFASDEGSFVEALETFAPALTEPRTEIASTPKSEISEEPGDLQATTSVAPHEPKPNPRPSFERLSSESPITVHVPRTLRPSVTPSVPPTTADEPLRERPRVRASTTVGPAEFRTKAEPEPMVHPAAPEVKESVTEEPLATTPTPRVATTVEEHQTPVPRQVDHEITPVPRVDRVDGPPKLPSAVEPSPPSVSPVHLPPVANNSARQEESRVHIGSLEVLVNNHPRVPTAVRPATAPTRTERLNLEKRYLERFRLRH